MCIKNHNVKLHIIVVAHASNFTRVSGVPKFNIGIIYFSIKKTSFQLDLTNYNCAHTAIHHLQSLPDGVGYCVACVTHSVAVPHRLQCHIGLVWFLFRSTTLCSYPKEIVWGMYNI